MRGRLVPRLDFYRVNFDNFMRLHCKLHNLSPNDFEHHRGLMGYKSLVQMFNMTLGREQKN